jgi:hypothetical protein
MSVGRVKSTSRQFLRKGDFVLPFGIKPTRDQIEMVEKTYKKGVKKRKKKVLRAGDFKPNKWYRVP